MMDFFTQAESPLIPTDVSPSCLNFLLGLDAHNDLATCTKALLTTTKAFAPGNKPGSADLTSTLQGLCHSNSGCSDSMLRGLLMNFNALCRDELVQPGHDSLRNIYDALYALAPFHAAICSTDPSTNQYCVNNIKSSLNHNTGPLSVAQNTTSNLVTSPVNPFSFLFDTYSSTPLGTGSSFSRRSSNGLALNTTTWKNLGVTFLLINSNGTPSQLCTPCSKSILQSYSQFESLIPYACGLANSPLIGGQLEIWKAMTSKCGNQFMNAIMSNMPGGSLAMHSGTVSVKAGVTGLSVMGTLVLGLFLAA